MEEDSRRSFFFTRHQPPATRYPSGNATANRRLRTRAKREILFLIKLVKISAVSGDFAAETFV
jgi:hypothetical protein